MMSAAVGMLSMICAGKALARQMRFLLSLRTERPLPEILEEYSEKLRALYLKK